MKVNGKRVKTYRDKLGPFDSYWDHGCIISYKPNGYKVTKAFDYNGDHFGILKRDHNIRGKLLYLCIPLIIGLTLFLFNVLKPSSESCVIYRPTSPYRIDSNTVGLEITNISDAPLYITIEDTRYTVNKGDTLKSVSLSSSSFTIIFEYKNHYYKEVVNL